MNGANKAALASKVSFYKSSLLKLKVKYETLKNQTRDSAIQEEQTRALVQNNQTLALQLQDSMNQIATLEEMLDRRSPSQCSICFDQQKDILLLPCCHFHFCHQCVSTIEQPLICPVCNIASTGHLRIYQ
jgi:rubrerythrin